MVTVLSRHIFWTNASQVHDAQLLSHGTRANIKHAHPHFTSSARASHSKIPQAAAYGFSYLTLAADKNGSPLYSIGCRLDSPTSNKQRVWYKYDSGLQVSSGSIMALKADQPGKQATETIANFDARRYSSPTNGADRFAIISYF